MMEDFSQYNFPEVEGKILQSLLIHYGLNISRDSIILDPCAGTCTMSNALSRNGYLVATNDINPSSPAIMHVDATDRDRWSGVPVAEVNWVISNPPFEHANVIVSLAYEHVMDGVAMSLPLSWLEPTRGRANFLQKHPPHKLIVLNPRPQYKKGKGGRRGSNPTTTAWFIWSKTHDNWSDGIVFDTEWKTHRVP